MLVSAIFLVIGFVILIKGADLFVDGACSIARILKISDLVIGLTIVAFGTSAPELIVNIMASIQGSTNLAIANITGSNISNIFLVLGISAIIWPLTVEKGTVWKEIPFCLLAAIILAITGLDKIIDNRDHSVLSRIDGFVFLGFFILFMYYAFSISKTNEEQSDTKTLGITKSILFIILGIAGLTLGGKWIVDNAVNIARYLKISESFIGLTVVALGTSLPELVTSIVAARKKKADIAVGNVVGSNIFNIFFILGISSVIKPLAVDEGFYIDISVTLFATFLLFLSMFTGKKHTIDRFEGIIFVVLYVVFIVFRYNFQ
ncbi:MAG: calcium/sodium antiporter [Spirochaetales bacterium]|nr:calcium/sodium antiporter [Spirochaetales bacterium]